MDTEEIARRDASPWQPMSDQKSVKIIGKFNEELSECISASSRCLIQGLNQQAPDAPYKVNKDWLEDEIADVEALLIHMKNHFRLDCEKIRERRIRKFNFLMGWFNLNGNDKHKD